jgi:uncharacterized membrane protein YkvA (DUF1232 family)
MPEKKTTTDIISSTQQGGLVRDMTNKIKLIFRLLGDNRVNAFVKLIPIGTFAYLLWPWDIAPNIVLPIIGMVDDAALLWIGTYAFTELCPPAVVEEHMKALAGKTSVSAQDEIVDAESTDVTEVNDVKDESQQS